MSPNILLHALVGLLPVLAFLGALLYLDSYKLVKLRVVVAMGCRGAMIVGVSYLANAAVLKASVGWAKRSEPTQNNLLDTVAECPAIDSASRQGQFSSSRLRKAWVVGGRGLTLMQTDGAIAYDAVRVGTLRRIRPAFAAIAVI